jgi:murein lipoprotein
LLHCFVQWLTDIRPHSYRVHIVFISSGADPKIVGNSHSFPHKKFHPAPVYPPRPEFMRPNTHWQRAATLLQCVAVQRQVTCLELHSHGKFDAVTVSVRRRNLPTGVAAVIQDSRINNPKGTIMKCASVVTAAAAVAVMVGLAGCTDLKPLQAQVDDLKAQLAKVQGDTAAAKSAADSANSAASSAGQAASGAQSTANQALAAAHASQSCCDATNEKIDRMFKRSVSK